MHETPITGRLSVFVDHVCPPSAVFHNPPPGEPIHIISLSKGSKAIQFILPLPLFLPFDKIIGVFIGPNSTQSLLLIDFKFSIE